MGPPKGRLDEWRFDFVKRITCSIVKFKSNRKMINLNSIYAKLVQTPYK